MTARVIKQVMTGPSKTILMTKMPVIRHPNHSTKVVSRMWKVAAEWLLQVMTMRMTSSR
ncbi:hypothetical protein B597_006540 [Stutzerimonas stutzeri KOS6]|uniref:Uncharacterized protein n=1 Tax=Stutzerimonas stutzeri KOS6 TaxID=1218352 RepID=A0A061JUN1_STUST|nr:hypothetical protein B597_006540 [Stutzerimonas stutzeri KOS6]